MGKSGFCQLEKSVYLCKPKTIDVMKLKAIILIFSLLFLPVVAAGQGRIQIPKKKTETVKPKPKKRKTKRKTSTTSKPQPVAKLTYNTSTGELVYGTHRYRMVYVEGGSFSMGATPEQVDPDDDEKPVHRVTLSSYSIGQTEVPQWLWVAVMGSNPSYWKGNNLPVEQVSWNDCQEFLGKLNNLTGMFFSLPTEAQWEYAARGGNRSRGFQYSGSDGLGAVAWYGDNSGGRTTHEVGMKGPNELGLYDMSGNVWEWCHDRYGGYPYNSVTNPKGASTGSNRVYRGGSWNRLPGGCRVANRVSLTPDYRCDDLGFRLAL